MTPLLTRRSALLAASALGLARPALAQKAPLKIGFLTVKTGPLAAGGIQEEQGLTLFLQGRKMALAGRPVQLFTADTGGQPANTRTKAQELVERNGVDVIIGPLAAVEALAIDDYVREKQVPVLCEAAAEDITQRRADPWVVRVTGSSGQCAHPLADYARKELRYGRMALIGDDFAFGHEQNAAFQRVFEQEGGKVVQKLWPPLNAPDYGTYIAQLSPEIDAVFMSFAGSNGLKFFKAYKEYGGDKPVLGGMTAVDEATLQQLGDEAIGMVSANFYSAQLDNPENKAFVAAMLRDYKNEPGYYASGCYIAGIVLEAALLKTGGDIENKTAFMQAMRALKIPDSIRGPMSFDQYGNVVCDIYIRRVEKKGGRLVNAVIKTYPNVSQFWTYDPAAFLKQPVYSRDWQATSL